MRRLRRSIPASAGMSAAKRIPCAPHPRFRHPRRARRAAPRRRDRRPHRSGRMGGRAAHHRFPPDPAAVARAGAASDRSLDPGDPGRPGGRLPQHPARERAAHPPARAARPGRRRPTASTSTSTSTATAASATTSPCCCRTASSTARSPTRTSSTTTGTATGATPPSEDGDSWSAEMLMPWHIAPMQQGQGRHAHDRHLAGPRDRRHRRAHVAGRRSASRTALPVGVGEGRGAAVQPVAAGDHARTRSACYDDVGGNGRLRRRRRPVLEAQRPVPAQRHAQPGLRPGRERPAGGQLRRDRDLLQRQAAVLHREPGLLRRAVRLAQHRQPADLHPPRRRRRRRRQRRRRRHRGGQAQRQRRRRSTTACSPRPRATTSAATSTPLRATRDFGDAGLGAMVTRVERPVPGPRGQRLRGRPPLDAERELERPHHRGRLGHRRRAGAPRSRDSGAQVRIDWDMGDGWRQQLYCLHLGDDLQLNDFGFLERNNFNYGRYELARRITDLPETSAYAAHDWRWARIAPGQRQRPAHRRCVGDQPQQRAPRRRQRVLRGRRLDRRATTT